MAVEQAVIDSKLQEEGIDVQLLPEGIQFETEEALDKWVGVAKTFTAKPKSIEEYTKEELEEILKDPSPKAKGLQGFADSLRQKQNKVDPLKQPKNQIELPEEIKAKLEKLDEFIGKSEKSQKEAKFNQELSKHTSGFDQYDIDLVKGRLTLDSTPDEIKKEVESFRSNMVKKGFSGYKVGGDKDGNNIDDKSLDDAVQRLVDKKNKLKK